MGINQQACFFIMMSQKGGFLLEMPSLINQLTFKLVLRRHRSLSGGGGPLIHKISLGYKTSEQLIVANGVK